MTPIIAALWLSASTPAGQDRGGAKPPADQKPPTAAEFANGYHKNQKRVNGAYLSIQADRVPGAKGEDIAVDWTIDYDGPRMPFIILAPTLTVPVGDQTFLSFYLDDDKGVGQYVHFAAELACVSPPPNEEHFAKSKGMKPPTGRLTVTVEALLEKAKKKGRTAFRPGDTVHVQLNHRPGSRGDEGGLSLDAWTGYLRSNVVYIQFQ